MKITRLSIFIALLLPICLFSQTTFFPTGDVYINKGTTGNDIRSMETYLKSYRNPATNDTYWSMPFLQFNLQNITSVVGNVKLRLYATINEPHGFDIYTTSLANWVEDALTYNNYVASTGTQSASPVAALDVTGGVPAQYYAWDVTNAVVSALANGQSAISFKILERYAVKTTTGTITAIYVQFHSKENPSGYKPQLVVTDKNIDPFKLSDLKVNGSLISGFAPTRVKYYITVPYNTTLIPSVTATSFNSSYNLSIVNAKNLTGTELERTTKITSKLGTDSVVFKVVFQKSAAPNDSRLDTLKINNVPLENFKRDTIPYLNYLPYSTTSVPSLTGIGVDIFAKITVTPPTNLIGTKQQRTAQINVVSQDGTTSKNYSVEFVVLPKLDIYIALGQSNMSGRGYMVKADSISIDSVYLLTPGGNMEIASNPLNKYSSLEYMGSTNRIGPACSFVKMMRTKTGHNIGLMQNSKGGSAIASWIKGSADKYYEEAIRRTLQAKPFGDIKGIIWHQGESNTSDTTLYKTQLSKMVTDFRSDLGLPNLFFIAGQINQWQTWGAPFNKMIQNISKFIPYSDWVSSLGLTPLIDTTDPHFDAPSQKILGEEYAAKMLSNVYTSLTTVSNSYSGNDVTLATVISSKGTLKIENVVQNASLFVYDVLGKIVLNQQVKSESNYKISLPSGIYLVQLSSDSNSQLVKVVL